MLLKSETFMLRICGNCAHATCSPEHDEIKKLERAYLKHQYSAYVALLRRRANPLRDAKTLCRKENIQVGILEEACAFWKEK